MLGMTKMDVLGFRRLRTISQLTFESFPEIILQIRIYLYMINEKKKADTDKLNIRIHTIGVSIAFALAHALIEGIFIYVETQANKTSMMNYLIICFNGRFGFVPYLDKFDPKNREKNQVLNYDLIQSSLFGQTFKMDYQFSEITM